MLKIWSISLYAKNLEDAKATFKHYYGKDYVIYKTRMIGYNPVVDAKEYIITGKLRKR